MFEALNFIIKKLPIILGITKFKIHIKVMIFNIVKSLTPAIPKTYRAMLPFITTSKKNTDGIIDDNKYIVVITTMAFR